MKSNDASTLQALYLREWLAQPVGRQFLDFLQTQLSEAEKAQLRCPADRPLAISELKGRRALLEELTDVDKLAALMARKR